MRTVISLVIVTMLSGCAAQVIRERQEVSSAHIGCSPEQIEIINRSNYSWTAKCKGKTFFCTVAPSASCKEEIQ